MQEGIYQVSSTIEIPFYEADTFTTHQFRPPILGELKQGDTFTVIRANKPDDGGFVRALILIGSGLTAFMAAIKIGEGVIAVAVERRTPMARTAVAYA